MRRSVVVVLVILAASGCGQAPPLTTHGKPVGHWVEALKGPDVKARKKAVMALGHVGTADPAALPALIEALKDRDAAVRAEAALALLNLGPAAKDAIPALEEATKDRDAKVRGYATKALERVRGG
jgi:HEAT repeat protein